MSKNVVGNLVLVFVAFPLETFKIANPRIKAFRYDPYLWKLFLEEYDHKGMEEVTKKAIERVSKGLSEILVGFSEDNRKARESEDIG